MTRWSGPWMSHPTAPTQVFLMLRKYSGNPGNGTACPPVATSMVDRDDSNSLFRNSREFEMTEQGIELR